MVNTPSISVIGTLLFCLVIFSCKKDAVTPISKDINLADKASIDRFNEVSGHLMVRTANNGLPAANTAIHFDQQPFITTGLDRDGATIHYYNFDVQPATPSPIYVFFTEGSTMPISGQNNVVGTIPGDAGYNDFWLVTKVMVPEDYVPNSLTSEAEILSSGHTIIATTDIVNCPIVPFGSTATRSKTAGLPSALTLGWYKGQAVAYFNFDEAPVKATSNHSIPLSPIYVMFNDNGEGPSSGFKTETENPSQTHNVLATIPGDAAYSPLWSVQVLDNIHFDQVTNLSTALSFTSSAAGASVNCPVVK